MRSLLVDNYDSFTYNLAHYLSLVNGEETLVIRNDEISCREVAAMRVDNIVLSPGPGHPAKQRDFGVCKDILKSELKRPVLGVCLGHQGIALESGGLVGPAPSPRHGMLSKVYHEGKSIFRGLPVPFQVVRYHSLCVLSIGDDLLPLAWADDGVLMALEHRDRPLYGVQFHPESVETEFGLELLKNFRDITVKRNVFISLVRQNQVGCALQQEKKTLPKQTDPKLQLFFRKTTLSSSVANLFSACFGSAKYAFWLDSSALIPGLSRFSYLGAAFTKRELVELLSKFEGMSLSSGSESDQSENSSQSPSALSLVTAETGDPELSIEKFIEDGNRLLVWDSKVDGESCGKYQDDLEIIFQREDDVLDYLGSRLGARSVVNAEVPFDFQGGFVGYLGYELQHKRFFNDFARSSTPLSCWFEVNNYLVVDHQRQEVYLVALSGDIKVATKWLDLLGSLLSHVSLLEEQARISPVSSHEPNEIELEFTQTEYRCAVEEIKKKIREGETYEVCLTSRLSIAEDFEPLPLYLILRQINPAPFAAFFRFGKWAILSSSPERFLSLRLESDGDVVEAKPIKGTIACSKEETENERVCQELSASAKNRAENLMIVDLIRNDLSRVCVPGTVGVPKLMDVERFETVNHLVSTVRGRLKPGFGIVDCVRAAFPGGSMTGAPKIRTLEIIKGIERSARGVYSGSLGYLSYTGSADLSIVIRTMVTEPGRLTLGSGGAIVDLSSAAEEYEELMLKARPLLRAIQTYREMRDSYGLCNN